MNHTAKPCAAAVQLYHSKEIGISDVASREKIFPERCQALSFSVSLRDTR